MTGLVFHEILLYDRSDDAVLRVLADAELSKASILLAFAVVCERLEPVTTPLAHRATRLMTIAFEEAGRLPEQAVVDDLRSEMGVVYDRQLAPLSADDTARWLDELIVAPAMCWRDVQMKITAAGMFVQFGEGGWLVFGQLARLLDDLCGPLPIEESEAAIRAQFPALSGWLADPSHPAFEACAREILNLEGLVSKVKADLQMSAAA